MEAIIQRVNNYFLQDIETTAETPITEKEFKEKYFHKTKIPYVNDKYELVYIIKENE